MQLGDAAQSVSVLHAVLLAVVDDLGAFQQLGHVLGDLDLAFLMADDVDTRIERVAQTGQALEGHGADDVAQLSGADGVVQSQSADGGHGAGAVGQAQAFLGDQGGQGLDASSGHSLSAGHLNTVEPSLALAQQRQGHVSQRSQVAGGAQGALLGDDGGDALVQHLDHHLDQDGTHAGNAHAQGIGAQQQHTAGDLSGVGLAHGGAVADDQVGGQGVGHLLGDGNALEVTETGGDTVGNAALGSDLLSQSAGLLHGLQSGVSQLDGGAETGDSDKGLQGQAVTIQNDVLDSLRIQNHDNYSFFI